MNSNGHATTLEAAQPGNRNRETHGAYSHRSLRSDEVDHLVEALMEAPHVVPLDQLAAEEIAHLVVQIRRIDEALADGVVERRGRPRALIDLRTRLSGRLERWLRQFGMTPASRAEWAETLARGSLAAEIARRRQPTADGRA
jgi:hypothetical protein